MSPRNRKRRKVSSPPEIKGFKPFGGEQRESGEAIQLLYEEYEALKLCDYDHYNHQEASNYMEVSRPTFTRIYSSALQKIARAFVEGRPMSIEGGHVYYDSDWYQCAICNCRFNHPDKHLEVQDCPLCGADEVSALDSVEKEKHNELYTYVCRKCNKEKTSTKGTGEGIPCESCGLPMSMLETSCPGENNCIS